uniref:Uncharacterized protein n=1 Tax=Anguilla anguilla TaxID=7936 RepID=A0A0E9XVB3_ANGAN
MICVLKTPNFLKQVQIILRLKLKT